MDSTTETIDTDNKRHGTTSIPKFLCIVVVFLKALLRCHQHCSSEEALLIVACAERGTLEASMVDINLF
jgi:hypothetical protein